MLLRQASFSLDGKLIAVVGCRGTVNVYGCESCGATGEELSRQAEARKAGSWRPAAGEIS